MPDPTSEWRDRLSAAQHALADAESHSSLEREIALLKRKVEELKEEGERRGFRLADEPRARSWTQWPGLAGA